MSPTIWKVLSGLLIVAFAALFIVGLVGDCGGMLETTAGGLVPMKCHWAFLAECYVAPLGALAAFFALLSRHVAARRVSATMAAATAIVAVLLLSPLGIGVCANAEMQCNASAIVAEVVGAAAFVLALVMALTADPSAASKPKRSI